LPHPNPNPNPNPSLNPNPNPNPSLNPNPNPNPNKGLHLQVTDGCGILSLVIVIWGAALVYPNTKYFSSKKGECEGR